ncbi:hypothetical protein SAMN04489713_11954 [Actinomadura madurae]|uniref:Uncharacterized protein n=1 Tax=Actinomadura madurae TaxID=1993 RepID=A0A1I5U660_9ACTN|nr:hypothetical protein SAMN04489713_11954 [Actinomadura madurae]SPT51998.1 Uncharacterised protein [Actinomadura madurae]
MSAANQGTWGIAPPQEERMSGANQGVWGIVPHKEDA